MQKQISLAEYVKKRNGVSLGAQGSMRSMFQRSLGAGSFASFWQYWNPIWGYYLSRYVMRPCHRHMPQWLAVVLTFFVSGALHDLAVSLVKWKTIFFFAPWFSLMGVVVVASKLFSLSYGTQPWVVRATMNLTLIFMTLWLSRFVMSMGS